MKTVARWRSSGVGMLLSRSIALSKSSWIVDFVVLKYSDRISARISSVDRCGGVTGVSWIRLAI